MLTKKYAPPEAQQAKLIGLLNRRLADAIDLQLQSRQAYWNVKGPYSFARRNLFDKVARAVEEYADRIAERLIQLGGMVEATAQAAARRSSLDASRLATATGKSDGEALVTTLIDFRRHAHYASEQATELKDIDTAELFREIARGIDQWIYAVETSQRAGS